ncbi:MAG TPA: hypothetical protein VNA14_13645 [Mycobacteriales bacterium]|nr:hypothetical protein [Mycobacteriales bacterium]
MRRLLLLLTALAACAGLLVPAQAAVYAGETLVAAAAVRIRGTDGNLYQVEVQVRRHDLQGQKVDHTLRFRLAVCGDPGCFGPWYPLEVDPADVVFTDKAASVRSVFAGSPFEVQWTARRAKKDFAPTAPAPDAGVDDGNVVASAHKDIRSAPAVVRLPGLACKTAASTMTNETGVVITQDEAAETPPRKLPSGFFPTPKRKPRCF